MIICRHIVRSTHSCMYNVHVHVCIYLVDTLTIVHVHVHASELTSPLVFHIVPAVVWIQYTALQSCCTLSPTAAPWYCPPASSHSAHSERVIHNSYNRYTCTYVQTPLVHSTLHPAPAVCVAYSVWSWVRFILWPHSNWWNEKPLRRQVSDCLWPQQTALHLSYHLCNENMCTHVHIHVHVHVHIQMHCLTVHAWSEIHVWSEKKLSILWTCLIYTYMYMYMYMCNCPTSISYGLPDHSWNGWWCERDWGGTWRRVSSWRSCFLFHWPWFLAAQTRPEWSCTASSASQVWTRHT